MRRYLMLALFVLTLAPSAWARTPAQTPPPQAAPPQAAPQPPRAAAQDEFVPVTGPVTGQESIPAPRLVAIAYGFIWVVIFGYVWSVRSRLSRVERELEAVSRRVPERK